MRAMLVTAILVALQPIEASAFTMRGAGASGSCGLWLRNRAEPLASHAMGMWALGFLSGAPFTDPRPDADPLGKTDADGVYYWLDNYCRANPTVEFSEAVIAFYREHRNKR
jgi:hypothetical protein